MSELKAATLVKYVGCKIAKVRWKPQRVGAIGNAELFASGSYDDKVNKICMWRFKDREEEPEYTRSMTEPELIDPKLVCEYPLSSGLTDLCFLDERYMVASLKDGVVVLLEFLDREVFRELMIWTDLHHLLGQRVPCTALAVCGEGGGDVNVVTGGEDGKITVLRTNDSQPLSTIDNADNSTVTALTCSMQLEVLSTSSSGQLKIWDLRTNTDHPTNTIVLPGDYVSMECLDRHPHQPHLVAIGRSDGSITFMDLRNHKHAVQLVQAHSDFVWEVKFDRSHPNNLFTCSQDGGLWHWDINDTRVPLAANSHLQTPPTYHHNPHSYLSHNSDSSFKHTPTAPSTITSSSLRNPPGGQSSFGSRLERTNMEEEEERIDSSSSSTPWLSEKIQHGKLHIQDYSRGHGFSINSLDIKSEHLVAGSDEETLLVVPKLTLR